MKKIIWTIYLAGILFMFLITILLSGCGGEDLMNAMMFDRIPYWDMNMIYHKGDQVRYEDRSWTLVVDESLNDVPSVFERIWKVDD